MNNVTHSLGGFATSMAPLATPQLIGVLHMRPSCTTETLADDGRPQRRSARKHAHNASEVQPNEHRLPAGTALSVLSENASRTGAQAAERAAAASALQPTAKAAAVQPTLSVLPQRQSAGWDPAAVMLHVVCAPCGTAGIEVQRAGLQLGGQTVPLAACHCVSYAVPRLGARALQSQLAGPPGHR